MVTCPVHIAVKDIFAVAGGVRFDGTTVWSVPVITQWEKLQPDLDRAGGAGTAAGSICCPDTKLLVTGPVPCPASVPPFKLNVAVRCPACGTHIAVNDMSAIAAGFRFDGVTA